MTGVKQCPTEVVNVKFCYLYNLGVGQIASPVGRYDLRGGVQYDALYVCSVYITYDTRARPVTTLAQGIANRENGLYGSRAVRF